MQIVKRGLKKSGEGSVKSRLAKFLFTYRLTPHTTTGVSPAEMFLGRSSLDILHFLTAERVEEKQTKQKSKHNAHAHERLLNEGDTVSTKLPSWESITITKKTGPVFYSVNVSDGRDRRCHQDQVKKSFAEVNTPAKEVVVDLPIPPPDPVPDSPVNQDSGNSNSPEGMFQRLTPVETKNRSRSMNLMVTWLCNCGTCMLCVCTCIPPLGLTLILCCVLTDFCSRREVCSRLC